jgi:SAM-dependent methyltransferase
MAEECAHVSRSAGAVLRERAVVALTKSLLEGVPRNGPTDPIEYYRRPLLGWLFRERINAGLRLLGPRFKKALEVGYGAGAVQLVLAPVVDELHGIDLDADPTLVTPLLESRGHVAHLEQGSVLELPYESSAFDLVVCFSVIEHLREYRRALAEMARVLTSDGRLLLGMPSVDRTMEVGFQLIGFKGIEDHHVTTPAEVMASFGEAGLVLDDESYLDLPFKRPLGLRLYNNWLLKKRM